MKATGTFTFRIRPEDLEYLSRLSGILRLSKSATIRFVICRTLQAFETLDAPKYEVTSRGSEFEMRSGDDTRANK